MTVPELAGVWWAASAVTYCSRMIRSPFSLRVVLANLVLPLAPVAMPLALGGCSRAIAPLVEPRASVVALTGGPNTSMIYLARTAHGVVVIDLGWSGGRGAFASALRTLNADSTDVRDVFLTHSHRDHTAAWRTVRHARFHLAQAELPYLLGIASHGGWITRLAERVRRSRLPRQGELDVRTFAGDTAFVLGADTLRAYVVAGHTPGSAAYLFRGVLFLGDAVTFSRWSGFAPAKGGFSNDTRQARESLERLWPRLPADGVRHVCTAHAHCREFSQRFRDDVAGRRSEPAR